MQYNYGNPWYTQLSDGVNVHLNACVLLVCEPDARAIIQVRDVFHDPFLLEGLPACPSLRCVLEAHLAALQLLEILSAVCLNQKQRGEHVLGRVIGNWHTRDTLKIGTYSICQILWALRG